MGQFRRNPVVEASPLQDETMLFHGDTGKFCILNPTSSAIWAGLGEAHTSTQIAEDLTKAFQGVTLSDAVTDVETALAEMVSLGLILRD